MEHGGAAAASFIATLVFFYAILILALIAFTIWVHWRIFAKAGYNGALSLLNFIPGIGQLICLIILAFGRWPIEDQLALLQGRANVVTPPSSPPPGTSVMPAP